MATTIISYNAHTVPPSPTFQPLLVNIGEPCAIVDGELLSLSPQTSNEGLFLP